MRLAVSIACFALVGCATDLEPETSSETTAVTLSESNTSVNWNPEIGCGPARAPSLIRCDGNFIWPAERGITSVQILIRKGPDGSEGPTFLAFVVWNQTTVGRIIRASVGAKGADLRATIGNISAARTFGFPDNSTGSTGTMSGGKSPPPPQPHVDEELVFSPGYLNAAKDAARAIHRASTEFTAYAE